MFFYTQVTLTVMILMSFMKTVIENVFVLHFKDISAEIYAAPSYLNYLSVTKLKVY